MRKVVTKLALVLNNLPKFVTIILGFFLIFLIGVIDYYITVDIALSIFYLFPVIIISWYANLYFGTLAAILSALSWMLGDLQSKQYIYAWLPYWNTTVRLGFFWIFSYLLSELKEAYEREKKFARIDSLTQSFNRRYFRELLDWEFKRSLRYKQPITLAYFDVDNFKCVNDNCGHLEGDSLLYLIAKVVTSQIRNVDTFGRMGGDEFALILPETNYTGAKTVLQRIHNNLLIAVDLAGYPVSFSIGAVTYQSLPSSIDVMLEQVDRLMYDVKNHGKNAIKHQLYQEAPNFEN